MYVETTHGLHVRLFHRLQSRERLIDEEIVIFLRWFVVFFAVAC